MYICRILLIQLLGCHIEINACLVLLELRALQIYLFVYLFTGTYFQVQPGKDGDYYFATAFIAISLAVMS